MKIGIITIQKSEVNYGACLQSFALWKYISDLGHDCEIIDLLRPCHKGYRMSPSFSEQGNSLSKKIKLAIRRLLKSKAKVSSVFNEKKAKFEQFNKLPNYTKTYHSVEELYQDKLVYDVYITGSDQVWNPNRNFLKDPYFLTFSQTGKKKISYASSFAIEHLPEELKTQYRNWLLQYNSISTREKTGSQIVETLTGKKAVVVADPVFLISTDKWLQFANEVEGLQPNGYVFLYLLHYNELYLNYAISLANEKSCPLYFVLSEDRQIDNPNATQLFNVGPREWLWLIANARMMITTSFHGSAFSIIFDTPFMVLLKRGLVTNTRITDLITSLNAIYKEVSISPEEKAMAINDFDKNKLSSMIDYSCNYLKEALSE